MEKGICCCWSLIKALSHLCLCCHFSDTDNELTTEVGGYDHVVVLKNIKVVDGDIVEALQQLPRGTSNGDCIHKVHGFMFWKVLLVNS